MRIGILGGTFDPPHIGHLVIAEEARTNLGLAKVYFVPANHPPHKLDEPISSLQDRVAMLRLALDNNPFFVLSLIEGNRPGPSYTVDTLKLLQSEFPPASELYFIMGLDSLRDLPTWHQPQELIQLARLAVLRRPGYQADLEALEQKIPGIKSRVEFIPAPELSISSTDLQERVRQGYSIRHLVPETVAEYIYDHALYRQ
jgi:nicotinate-nucleotide adenylyltransferase